MEFIDLTDSPSKRAKRVVSSDDEDSAPQQQQLSKLFAAIENRRPACYGHPETLVGERIAVMRDGFQASNPETKPAEDYLLGFCEAWCPARRSYLVVFDEPFDDIFDKFAATTSSSVVTANDNASPPVDSDQRKSLKKPRSKVTLTRLSVAIWNDQDKYITYEIGDHGAFGGSCAIRKGGLQRRSCHWWAAWITEQDYVIKSKAVQDEPIYCVCFRTETAEPPPPLLSSGSEVDLDKCVLISCENCEEWFHKDCAEMVSSQRQSLGAANPAPTSTTSHHHPQSSRRDSIPSAADIESAENWKCPLCDGSVQALLPADSACTAFAMTNSTLMDRARAWKLHSLSKQPAWTNPLVQWQWWTNGPSDEGEGFWVFAICTLRRFVNRKGVDDSVAARSDLAYRGITELLNRSYPESVRNDSEQDCEEAYWKLAVADLRLEDDHREVRSNSMMMDQPRASSPSSSLGDALDSGALAMMDIRPQQPLPCSRTRSVERHMAIMRKRKRKERKKAMSSSMSSTVSSSTSSVATTMAGGGGVDTDGRNQRLATRHIASAVGESALTIGRRRQLRFGRSNIHMWGVFADEPIGAGEFVAEYMGELISQKETDRRFAEYMSKGMSDYLFRIDDNLICDATMKGSIARFINHSCEPNCEAKIVTHQNQKRIALYAVKDIRVGEELCYDYKFPIEEGADNKIPCNCGAKRCKKVMN